MSDFSDKKPVPPPKPPKPTSDIGGKENTEEPLDITLKGTKVYFSLLVMVKIISYVILMIRMSRKFWLSTLKMKAYVNIKKHSSVEIYSYQNVKYLPI